MKIRTMKMLSATVLASVMIVNAAAEGYRTVIRDNNREIPVCVVKGSPREMGYAFGKLFQAEAKELIHDMLEAGRRESPEEFSNKALDAAWATQSPFIADRLKEEIAGVAAGCGGPLADLQRVHMIPLISDYSCSSLALWDKATSNGDLYLTRNLDWEMAVRAHDRAALVVYLPDQGIAHLNVSFAGYVGSNTGMNAAGIALSEMGDSPGRDKPYDLKGVHFTMLFREIMYEADTLEEALGLLHNAPRIKKYHYVFGSGREKKSAKIKAHAPSLEIWPDNDPKDELAPAVAEDLVYNDEGRGAFPHLKKDYGRHTPSTILNIVKLIPIRGSNVLDIVYDATSLDFWISYAQGETEAYKMPFVHGNLKTFMDFDKPLGPVLARIDAEGKMVANVK
jgi:isopenicillin-N N-acyltransferase like protein